MSLVEVGVQAAPPGSPHAPPICTVGVRATIPPENGLRPVRAIVRAPKDKEGVITCAALLADGRILVVRQVREENLLGETTTKSGRTILRHDTPASIGPIALDGPGTNLYAGTSDGVLLWWRLDDDGRVAEHEVTPAFADKRAITSLGVLLGDVSLAVGDARGQLTTWFFVHTGARLVAETPPDPHAGAPCGRGAPDHSRPRATRPC